MANEKGEAILGFNKNTMKLINILISINKTNIIIDQLKRQVSMGISANPLMLIEMIGPYFFEYKEKIIENVVQFLEYEDFSEHYGKSGDRRSIEAVMSTIRASWDTRSEIEKKIISEIIKDLVKTYLSYLIACK
jgi:hypothetical protein